MLVAVTALFLAGCDTLLTRTPSPTSPLVSTFGVNTNEPNLVAYLEAADKLNTAVNVTATEAPIHMLLAGLTTLAAAGAGWWGRHVVAQKAIDKNSPA